MAGSSFSFICNLFPHKSCKNAAVIRLCMNSAYSLSPLILWSCRTRGRRVTIPREPRGRKSFPTTLSNTDDLPELWPPTTAMAGSESQRVGSALSSPWSPRAVHARCSLLTSEMRFSMAAAGARRRNPSQPPRWPGQTPG
ncbi:Os01g0681150 [Oryza sativa Japonica Group]|uniref:Os01g0681150 protein n=1 Tax=Oryza sativa subsp. japonica TaxID=39947 RepID=A0A0P0V6K4_ORYSJ|nr:Os01g0681150 [Oryza sativa Japonica Group]